MKYFSLMVFFAFAISSLDALRCMQGHRRSTAVDGSIKGGFHDAECESSEYCFEWTMKAEKYNFSLTVKACEKEFDRQDYSSFVDPYTGPICNDLDSDGDGNWNTTIGNKIITMNMRCCNTDLCNDPQWTAPIASKPSTTRKKSTTGAQISTTKPLKCNYRSFEQADDGDTEMQCTNSKYCVDWLSVSPNRKPVNVKFCEDEYKDFEETYAEKDVDCEELIENGNGCKILRSDHAFNVTVCCCSSDLCNDRRIKQESAAKPIPTSMAPSLVPETAAEIATTTTQAINTTGVTDVEDSVKKPLSCYVGGKTKNVKQRLVDEQGYKTVQCLESEYCVDYSMTSPADETLNINIKNCDGEIGELDAMIPRGNVDCKDLIENGNGCHMLRDDGIFKLKVCCCESDMCNNVGIELSNISAARNTTSSLKLSGPDVEIMGNESSEKLAPISSGNKPSV